MSSNVSVFNDEDASATVLQMLSEPNPSWFLSAEVRVKVKLVKIALGRVVGIQLHLVQGCSMEADTDMLTHTHTFTHAHTHAHTHMHTHTCTHTHSHTHSLTHSITHTLSHTLTHTCTLNQTHTHSHLHTHTHSLPHTHCHPHTLTFFTSFPSLTCVCYRYGDQRRRIFLYLIFINLILAGDGRGFKRFLWLLIKNLVELFSENIKGGR